MDTTPPVQQSSGPTPKHHISHSSHSDLNHHGSQTDIAEQGPLEPARCLLTHVIQRIHHQPEPLDPLQIVLSLLNVPVSRMDVDARRRVEVSRRRGRHERFGL